MSWPQIKHFDVPFFTPLSYGKRTHKLCQLPNGIVALLISDPAENSSGCSLTVATGSHNDPDGIPGLAHLCEHMLLSGGSRKYSTPGLYHEIIAKNNGSYNASTTGEQTTFAFELPHFHNTSEACFEKVIDIFASCFAEPLFDQTLINKEIYAIQNEHDSNTSDVTKILYHAERLLANPGHPFSRFATGNICTLKNLAQSMPLNLRNSLVHYFKENFGASKMTICIRGPQSVHGLAKLAVSKFSDLKSNRISEKHVLKTKRKVGSGSVLEEDPSFANVNILHNAWKQITIQSNCFAESPEHNAIFVESTRNPIVRFLFPVQRKNTRLTRRDIMTYGNLWYELFGDEAPGSICLLLKEKCWITSCYAFTSHFAVDNLGLVLELSLTNSGWHNIEFIAHILTFSVIPTFSQKYTVELARFLSEQYSIDITNFLYSTAKTSPIEECSHLSTLLQEDLNSLDATCIFKGSPMILNDKPSVGFFEESKESEDWWIGQAIKFQGFLKEFMNSSNMRMIFFGCLNECSLFEDKTTQKNVVKDSFYEFEYAKSRLYFKHPKKGFALDYEFHFPVENYFKPQSAKSWWNLKDTLSSSSHKSQQASLGFTVKCDLISEPPQLVSRNEHYELWVVYDNSCPSFESKSFVSFDIKSLGLTASAENTMHLEILGQLILLSLSSRLYPSLKLGFSYEVYASPKGDVRIGFTISGFAERLVNIVEMIITVIKDIATDPSFPSKEMLRKARVLVRSVYENAANESSIKVASVGLLILMERNMWTLEDRIEALESIDRCSFKQFTASFTDGPKYLILFIQGVLSCADDINDRLDRFFTSHLRGSLSYLPCERHLGSTKILDPGTNVYFEHTGRQEDSTNSITYFIQTGLRTDSEAFTMTALTEYLMSFTLVSELRNRRQIGYIVLGGLRLLCDTMGLHITIMSGTAPLVLETRVNEYLAYLENEVLGNMHEEKFQEYVSDYLKLLKGGNLNRLEKCSGPANLLNEVAPNAQNGDDSTLKCSMMKIHKTYKHQILDGQYRFSDGDEAIDADFLQRLSIARYMRFFRDKVSLHSKTRSKLSVMVKSPMTDEEIFNRQLFQQLEAFLRLNGFAIETAQLREIVERSEGKPRVLVKELYHCFSSRHEAWKLCTVMLRELFKALGTGFMSLYGKEISINPELDSTPAVELKMIQNANIYKQDLV